MNAPTPFPVSLEDAVKAATDDVNRWRGHCVDLFACIERDCIQAIDAMIASGRMPELRRALQFGARVEALRKGLESGHFGKKPTALNSLNELSNALSRRNDIVHGIGKVWVDSKGGWQWEFTYRSTAKANAVVSGQFKAHEAECFERALSAGSQSLRDTLRNLIKQISEPAVTE